MDPLKLEMELLDCIRRVENLEKNQKTFVPRLTLYLMFIGGIIGTLMGRL